MRPSRLLLASSLLLASLGSCAKKEPSEVVLVFSSTLSTGDGQGVDPDVGLLELRGERSGNDIYALIPIGRNSLGINRFPASTVLYNRDDNVSPSTTGNLRVRAFLDENSDTENATVLFSHSLIFNLAEEQRRVLTLPLQMACKGIVCENSETCFDGVCLAPPNVDAASLPLYAEATDPTRPGAACLDISAAGPCLAGSVRVSSRALFPADALDGSCAVRIPREQFASLDGTSLAFNVSAVWTETRGRYEVLDQIPEETPGHPGRKPANSWKVDAKLGSGPVTFTLPPGICQHAPYNNQPSPRLQQVVFSVSSAAGCATKTPTNDACDLRPDKISASSFACANPDYTKTDDVVPGACRKCLLGQIAPLAGCADDVGCKQVVACQLACNSLHDDTTNCSKSCVAEGECISADSLKKAKVVLGLLTDADRKSCQNVCQP